MEPYGPETYGEAIADVYDSWHHLPGEGVACGTLAALAEGGRVLELGVGTGRVALPLAATGLEVHGIDASPAMVEQLRSKPGGDEIVVTVGDMADVEADGPFSLVFVVFNTLFLLSTQAEQVRCFGNVFDRLAPGGRFVIEAFVPDVTRFDRQQNVTVRDLSPGGMRIDGSIYDPATQTVTTTQARLTERGTKLVHARLRFAYPAELDLMGELAGFELEHRWGSFERDAFTGVHAFAVSVFRKPR